MINPIVNVFGCSIAMNVASSPGIHECVERAPRGLEYVGVLVLDNRVSLKGF